MPTRRGMKPSAVRDIVAMLAEHGHDPLRTVEWNHRHKGSVEEEPDLVAWPVPVEIELVTKLGTAREVDTLLAPPLSERSRRGSPLFSPTNLTLAG